MSATHGTVAWRRTGPDWLAAAILFARAIRSRPETEVGRRPKRRCAHAEPARKPTVISAAAASHKAKIEAYVRARRAYEREAAAYWKTISEKRSARLVKRRNHQPVELADYVLTQPPTYTGPPQPPGYRPPPPKHEPTEPRLPIPVIADFLAAAAEQFQFVPDRPKDDAAFKRAYAKVAIAAGLTREQAVRIYAFETGGNGTYDGQAGIVGNRKDARPISPAMGYNQLLSTNTVSLLAEHGDRFLGTLRKSAEGLSGPARRRWIARSRR